MKISIVIKEKLIIYYLFFCIIFIGLYSYTSIYFGISNSLKFNTYFILMLLPIVFYDLNKFLSFLLYEKTKPILILFIAFFLIDLSINFPINKYKFDTYSFIFIFIILRYIFQDINVNTYFKFAYFILIFWLVISIIELIIIIYFPILHSITYQSIGIQTVIKDYLPSSQGIHGLGLTSQANIGALISLFLINIYLIISLKSIFYKFLVLTILIINVIIIPFSLSLTAILSVFISILFVISKYIFRFSLNINYLIIAFFSITSFSLIFILGEFFSFSAQEDTSSYYIYELFGWPIKYLEKNFIPIILGFDNNVNPTEVPLENRYFNLILSLGLIFTLFIFYYLYVFHLNLYENLFENNNVLKFLIFTTLCVSYFHISYLPHTNSIIILALMLNYSTSNLIKN